MILLLPGCAGIGDSYSKQDIRRDLLRVVPADAHIVSIEVDEADSFNRTLSASALVQMPGRNKAERIRAYVETARAHGWKMTAQGLENGHTYLIVDSDMTLTQPEADEITLVMQ